MFLSSPLLLILVVWGLVVLTYGVLLFIGSLVGLREEDTLYLSAGEARMEAEQREIQRRISRIDPYKHWFGLASLAMTVLLAAVWSYSVVRELLH